MMNRNVILSAGLILTLTFSACLFNNPDVEQVQREAAVYGGLIEIPARRLAAEIGEPEILLDLSLALQLVADEGKINEEHISRIFERLNNGVDQDDIELVRDIETVYSTIHRLAFPDGINSDDLIWRNVRIYFAELAKGIREGYDSQFPPE